MNRRDTLYALLALGAAPRARAQQPVKIRRIGVLAIRPRSTPSEPEVFQDSFLRGMRDLGYLEGKNLTIDWRFADGRYERTPALAAELVRLNPEVIVTHSTPAAKALQAATNTIPIVIGVGDPVGSGFAATLARPGGNVTGLSVLAVDLSSKQMDLLKSLVPGLSRMAFLTNPDAISMKAIGKSVQVAANSAAIKVVVLEARTAHEIESSFSRAAQDRMQGMIVPSDAFFMFQRRQIAELAAKTRIPAMFSFREQVVAGGLVSYGQDLAYTYHRLATYVDKILKGAKPGELPFEQPTKIHLAINRKTANALRLTIPPDLLLLVDEVIE
jgi:putative tryptophan/tyrosine transport system substrate-binding protein